MDLSFSRDELDFRAEVRAFFRDAVPQDIQRTAWLGQRINKEQLVRWQGILNARGWAVPHWAVKWGGTGWSATRQFIFRDELQRARAPEPQVFNTMLVGPVLIEFGSEAQKRRYLPRIANLDDWWCQGFSEPSAGSDLASLRTTARREGDHYVVTGQKLWTTQAHHADWMFALVRTDTAATSKQRGLSFLLIDMRSPGVTVRPLITLDRDHETNEVFLDEVRVPVANLVGEENKGWTYAKFLLRNERTAQARVGIAAALIAQLKGFARHIEEDGIALSDSVRFREKLAVIEIELKALEINVMRAIAAQGSGGGDSVSSILKLKGSELRQQVHELMLEAAGPHALAFSGAEPGLPWVGDAPEDLDWASMIAPNYFFSRVLSIYGGSNEIQRNIIAKAELGL